MRVVRATIAIVALLAALVPGSAAPVTADPVLRPDSNWEATSWGYRRRDFVPPASGSMPAVLTMDGYDGAGVPNAYLRMDDGELMALRIRFGDGPRKDYARVFASIRGTECSGGQFNLYDRRHAWDGHRIVEWIAAQPWSNGRVGMIGHSFSGQTAYWVATTRPPHLAAISANLVHADIYRDLFMPGGVQNNLFPVLWYATGPHRTAEGSVARGTIPGDEICTQHQASRYSAAEPPAVMQDPIWAGIEPTDNDWYAAHAAANYGPLIDIPYYQQNNWHDEQTGPRAAVLFHYVNPKPRTIVDKNGQTRTVVPKKMSFANGGHGHGGRASHEQWDWFDIWLLDKPDASGLMDERVVNYFDIRGATEYSAKKSGASWPFPDTDWRRLYLGGDGTLADVPPGESASDPYVSGPPLRNWPRDWPNQAGRELAAATSVPDGVVYESAPLEEHVAVAGPILLELYASITGIDTDFFVALHEVHADGSVSYLQRGLLKASHRSVDESRSFYAGGQLVQPYRPHTNPEYVVPGEVNRYDIEIWPLGHIFRPGSKVRVAIHTPPVVDGSWGYTATQHAPGIVNVHHGGLTPSALLLPVVTPEAGTAPMPDGCRVPGGFPCVPASPL